MSSAQVEMFALLVLIYATWLRNSLLNMGGKTCKSGWNMFFCTSFANTSCSGWQGFSNYWPTFRPLGKSADGDIGIPVRMIFENPHHFVHLPLALTCFHRPQPSWRRDTKQWQKVFLFSLLSLGFFPSLNFLRLALSLLFLFFWF